MGTGVLQENDTGCHAEVIQVFDIFLEKLAFYGILANGFFLANHVSNLKTFVLNAILVLLGYWPFLEIEFSSKVLAAPLGTWIVTLFFVQQAEDCGYGVQDFSLEHENFPTPLLIWSAVSPPAFHLCFSTLTTPVFRPPSTAVGPPLDASLACQVYSCQNCPDPPLIPGQEMMQVPTKLALVPVSRVHFVHHLLSLHCCDVHLSFFTTLSKISGHGQQPS